VSDYVSNTAYHEDTSRISASMLNVFKRSRRLYHARYIAKSIESDSTPRLELGSAIHSRLLEPDRYVEDVAIAPDCDRRTKAGKEAHAAFLQESEGKIVIDAKAAETVEAVAKSVREVPLARFMLDAVGEVETPVYWESDVGLQCKARPDKWMPNTATILDLKTSSDGSPWAFQQSLMKFGYAVASRHYSDGCKAERFVWLVADINPPFEVFTYELDERSVAAAESMYRSLLSELAAAYEEDEWHLIPKEITRLSLPSWALPKEATT
jgi:exodeoxyribonuclease VIII